MELKTWSIVTWVLLLYFSLVGCQVTSDQSSEDSAPNVKATTDNTAVTEITPLSDSNQNDSNQQDSSGQNPILIAEETNFDENPELDTGIDKPKPVDSLLVDTKISFNVTRSKALLVQSKSSALEGGTLLSRVVSSVTTRADGEPLEETKSKPGTTNIIAIDTEGNSFSPILSNFALRIAFTIMDPAGEYLYVVLDSGEFSDPLLIDNNDSESNNQTDSEAPVDETYGDTKMFIAKENCAVLRVSMKDDSYTCVMSSVIIRGMDQKFREKINGNLKPIQFDNLGNLFFIGSKFDREQRLQNVCDQDGNCSETTVYYYKGSGDWNPKLYKILADGSQQTLTTENEIVQFFIVLSNGNVAYSVNPLIEDIGYSSLGSLYLNQNGKKIVLDEKTDLNSVYYGADTHESIFWGPGHIKMDNGLTHDAMNMARPSEHADQGYIRSFLDLSIYSKAQFPDVKARRLISGDDGRLYAALDIDLHEDIFIHQILPYNPFAIAKIKIDDQLYWWQRALAVDFKISKGYLIYSEQKESTLLEKPSNVIKLVKISDGSEISIFSEKDYALNIWLLTGDIIYFCANDWVNGQLILGEIDMKILKSGKGEAEYLRYSDVVSSDELAAIMDIEIVTPKQPNDDTGANPIVQQYLVSPENIYSASLDFSKYMNKESVEENITLVDKYGNIIPVYKAWIYQTLHLIVDTDGLENSTYSPLAHNESYTISIKDSARDAWGWEITSMNGIFPLSLGFTTEHEYGWFIGNAVNLTDLSSGNTLVYTGKPNPEVFMPEYQIKKFDPYLFYMPANFRMQISAKNWGTSGFRLHYYDENKLAIHEATCQVADQSCIFGLTFAEQSILEVAHLEGGQSVQADMAGSILGAWLGLRVDLFGSDLIVSYSNDGISYNQISNFNISGIISRSSDRYSLFMIVDDKVEFDNMIIYSLDESGVVGDVLLEENYEDYDIIEEVDMLK